MAKRILKGGLYFPGAGNKTSGRLNDHVKISPLYELLSNDDWSLTGALCTALCLYDALLYEFSVA